MNPTSMVLRWYRQSTSRAGTRQQFTTEEVLQLLRPNDTSTDPQTHSPTERRADRLDDRLATRSEIVRQAAARPAAWLGELTKRQRQEIGGLADRLPTLVFHHTVGGEPGELLRRFGGWSTWRYERALEVAGTCIASHLNATSVI